MDLTSERNQPDRLTSPEMRENRFEAPIDFVGLNLIM